MSDLVVFENGRPTVSSDQVARRFGKAHRNVMRDIAHIERDADGEMGTLRFERSTYTTSQNKVLPCVLLGRDEFSLLAMGFTGKAALKWKIKYIQAFNAMESSLLAQGPASVMGALNEAMRMMKEDQAVASACGTGLSRWKEVRKKHMQTVERLHKDVQLILGFE